MKKAILLITCALALLLVSSCEKQDPVSSPGSSGSSESHNAMADFIVEVKQPLTVVCTNKSKNEDYVEWNFGDGSKSYDKNPTHKYKNIGVYKITLSVARNAQCSKNVTIEAPTKIYFQGFYLKKFDIQNKYVKVTLTDDYILIADTWYTSSWNLISNVNLPYLFSANVLMNNIEDFNEFRFNIYTNSKKSDSGQSLYKKLTFSKSTLLSYPDSIIWETKDGGIQASAIFSYK